MQLSHKLPVQTWHDGKMLERLLGSHIYELKLWETFRVALSHVVVVSKCSHNKIYRCSVWKLRFL